MTAGVLFACEDANLEVTSAVDEPGSRKALALDLFRS